MRYTDPRDGCDSVPIAASVAPHNRRCLPVHSEYGPCTHQMIFSISDEARLRVGHNSDVELWVPLKDLRNCDTRLRAIEIQQEEEVR